MFKKTVLLAALGAACVVPYASAADDKELAAIRAQIQEMKQSYEARMQALEQRLQEAQAAVAQAQNAAAEARQAAPASAVPPPPSAPAVAANAFNPNISMVLGGSFARLSQDPVNYRLQGFIPPEGEIGPGQRSFNLGESELTLAANIDPRFAGQLTFALSAENEVEVEEAYVRTRALGGGFNLKAGRFLSGIGYLNGRHAHTWDFADAPLGYQAFFGGQYKPDGVQARWLAPTDTFIEVGAELGNGRSFPGNDRNKNGVGAGSVFVHAGDDIGSSSSWRAGLSLLRTGSTDRAFDDAVPAAFAGRSTIIVADAVYKWAPNGDPSRRNLTLQAEYLRRKETGELSSAGLADYFRSTQSGWYAQAVYQFLPGWRSGLRYDRLTSGSPRIGLVESGALGADAIALLAPFSPTRTSLMFDYSPSEFSRLRLQFARERSQPGVTDKQVILQYIMSLGTHAAHAF
jgi:hypothetical protein